MDDIRGSLSKMKKNIKYRLTGKKRKGDKARAGGHGEGVESSGSLPSQSVTGGGHEREGDEPGADDESVGPTAAADESASGWTTTATASAKLLLRGVSSSSDAFGPLKSVAGGLCFILENCEVRLPPTYVICDTHLSRSVRRRTRKRSNRWHRKSRRSTNCSASLFLRVI